MEGGGHYLTVGKVDYNPRTFVVAGHARSSKSRFHSPSEERAPPPKQPRPALPPRGAQMTFSLPRRAFALVACVCVCACASTREAQGPSDSDLPGKNASPGRFSSPLPDETLIELDTNGDGRADVLQFWSAPPGSTLKDAPPPRLLRKEVDLNFDGLVDVWSHYGADGQLVRQTFDLDFDGRPDVTAHYEKGVIVKKEVFHSFGDRPDTFKYYERGKLTRIERDTTGDGRIDTWEYWDGDTVDRVGQDVDGDGNVDKWLKPKAQKVSSTP